jgi:hypothetical protein
VSRDFFYCTLSAWVAIGTELSCVFAASEKPTFNKAAIRITTKYFQLNMDMAIKRHLLREMNQAPGEVTSLIKIVNMGGRE